MSRLPFELLLAVRYLRPKRTFVSIITLISVLGVTLGVAVLIIVIAVMTGFDHDLREKILGFNAHLTVFQFDPATGARVPMPDYEMVMNIVNSNRDVTGSAPLAIGPVLLQTERASGGQNVATPMLRGIAPGATDKLSLITSNIVAGTSDVSGDGILVGRNFADDYGLSVGDRVIISSPSDMANMVRTATNGSPDLVLPKDFVIRGIFDTHYYEWDDKIVICSLANYQDLNGLDDDVDGVAVMITDPFQANRVRDQLSMALGGHYTIMTWDELDNTMSAVIVEKNVMLYILFFIVIVAAFGITCTLITFVVLKTRDIGVMKALGASARQVMWIFLSQSMIVSTLGVLTGLAAGTLAVAYRNPFLHLMRHLTGWELFPANIYNFTELPALIVPGDLLIICGGSFVICLAAAAFPAWHASRLKPVEALRHE